MDLMSRAQEPRSGGIVVNGPPLQGEIEGVHPLPFLPLRSPSIGIVVPPRLLRPINHSGRILPA